MKCFIASSLAILVSLYTTAAFAKTPDEIKATIQSEMNQRHPNPPKDFWSRLGVEALPVIKQMYKTSEDVYERSWLIDGMGYFKDDESAALLKNGIRDTEDEVLKKKMLSSLIQSQGDAAYEFAEPYLKDGDGHIRMAVAQGMRDRMDSERAKRRLLAFYQNEKVAWVKAGVQASPNTTLQKLKRSDELALAAEVPAKQVEPTIAALSEKEWIGEWKGVFITLSKTGAAKLTLTRPADKWKAEIKVGKGSKQEFGEKEVEVVYYQTQGAHWLEVRNRKTDAVFIGHRKPKQ